MAWYRHKQSMEQHREPRNKPHAYGQLTHDKEGKNNNKKQKNLSTSSASKTGQLCIEN